MKQKKNFINAFSLVFSLIVAVSMILPVFGCKSNEPERPAEKVEEIVEQKQEPVMEEPEAPEAPETVESAEAERVEEREPKESQEGEQEQEADKDDLQEEAEAEPVNDGDKPDDSQEAEIQGQETQGKEVTVYVTKTGKRYHLDNNCNGGTYYKSTLEDAIKHGLTPCEKCAGG